LTGIEPSICHATYLSALDYAAKSSVLFQMVGPNHKLPRQGDSSKVEFLARRRDMRRAWS